jgi:hypothetical protein
MKNKTFKNKNPPSLEPCGFLNAIDGMMAIELLAQSPVPQRFVILINQSYPYLSNAAPI